MILLSIIALYVLILIVLSILANNKKGLILSKVNNAVHQLLPGDAHINDIEINMWRYFPKIEIRLIDVSYKDTLRHEPLFVAKTVSTTFNIVQLIQRNLDVRDLKVANGSFHLFTDSSGYSNNYLLKPKQREIERPGKKSQKVFIDNVELQNFHVVIDHAQKEKKYDILIKDMDARIKKVDTVLNIRLKEKCLVNGLGFNLAQGIYLQNQEVEGTFNIKFNLPQKSLQFSNAKASINKQLYTMGGNFNFSDSGKFSLKVDTRKLVYKQALSILTEKIQRKLSLYQLSEPINVTAEIEGPLMYKSIPFVRVEWTTEDNILQTPIATFDKCSFKGSYFNERVKGVPRTDPNSMVVFDNFVGNWEGIQVAGSNIMITDLANPTLDVKLQSTTDFPALDNKFNLQTIRFIEGIAVMTLQYNGPLTANVALLQKLSGAIHVKDGIIQYEPKTLTFTNCNGDIIFNENDISINNFKCDLNKSHFEVQVQGKNAGAYMQSDPAKAMIVCNVTAPFIDLGDFKSVFSRNKTASSARKKKGPKLAKTLLNADEILENGTLSLNMKAGHIVFDQFDATAFNSNILFRKDDWLINNISLNTAGGSLTAKGSVQQPGAARHDAKIAVAVKNVNVQKLFYEFNEFGQNGITSRNLRGNFTADADIALGISSSGSVVANSITGAVDFSLKNGALVNYKPLENIKNFILRNRDLSNVKFAELKNRLDIDHDKIHINRMEIQSNVLSMFVEGIYGLNGNSNILIQLPLSNLGKKDDKRPQNVGVHSKVGPSIFVRAVSGDDGKMKFKLTFSKKIKARSAGNDNESAGDEKKQ
ncbi:AsmA-like C-terminal region-containing protein [Danxiaibacter flavus]|uniref:AsmA-like C-terminal region-containing protein n=1 Tax=Danxiaibacter flavus TaxID=3049108 RepID=A0ABV3ZGM7_9BACT|nr:AsmA-like C-terminal region-containing protein [Chitinophagaceae bacterium DXS]